MSHHKCPVEPCQEIVPNHMLMCRDHWRTVPATIKSAVRREYKRAPRSENHFRAMKIAVESAQQISAGAEPHQTVPCDL